LSSSLHYNAYVGNTFHRPHFYSPANLVSIGLQRFF
jgi:hypothetical protein